MKIKNGHSLLKSGPGGRNMAAQVKTKRKVDIVCEEDWLPPYAPSHPGKDKMGEGNRTNKGAPSLPGRN